MIRALILLKILIFDPINYQHFCFNLNNNEQVNKAIQISDPDIIIHLAAESHVDRSIENPKYFIESNIVGTFNLLQSSTNFGEIYLSKENQFLNLCI